MQTDNGIIIGLTGSFGSGCSILKETLEELAEPKFKGYSLSNKIWEGWDNKNKGKDRNQSHRSELQDIGNDLRKEHGNDYFVNEIIEEVEKDVEDRNSVVIDSIRNLGEIEPLRKLDNFYLIAVECPSDMRWGRVKEKQYENRGLNKPDFDKDDKRDKNEDGIEYGQQVARCVDEADILIYNQDEETEGTVDVTSIKSRLITKLNRYIKLCSGELRPPKNDEFYMSLAYTASMRSRCHKRQVGAVIHDDKGNVLSIGYNENLEPMEPCYKFRYDCSRDLHKRKYFKKLKDKGYNCPECDKPIDYNPDFKCKNDINEGICNHDLDDYFLPDNMLSKCRALHAEERALMTIPRNMERVCTLYTTASPCYTCGVKIVNAPIKKVVYAEAYSDTTSLTNLIENGVSVKMFEGVKAKAYFRLFSKWREKTERDIAKRVEETT